LFAGLIDDAAVFPPGNAPLAQAVARHAVHRMSPYAGLVGPLLVPVGALGDLGRLARNGDHRLRVGAVARPGTPLADVVGGLGAVDGSVVEVAGLEVGTALDRVALLETGVPLTVEVGRGSDQAADLDGVAADVQADHSVQAKFRTGPTPTWAWPAETELAAFLRAAADRRLPFKLTGGLHHAVRGTYPTAPGAATEEQHGLLNVLLAVHRALRGDDVAALALVLADRDSVGLVGAVRALTSEDTAAVRRAFTAYGCCGVTDPITELADLGLLEGLAT
jgi:hypothetical protein